MEIFNIINENNNIDVMENKLNQLNSMEKEDEAVMYILVNNDLRMEKGKIAGQCCHSACRVTRICEYLLNKNVYQNWVEFFEPKIILKATEEDLNICLKNFNDINKDIWCIPTRDIGRTQITKGSLTTVAFCPIIKKNCPEIIKKLKLL